MNAQRRNSWMWAEACALLEQAENRHRRFFDLLTLPATRPVWEPPANILAVGSEVHVTLAVPGARAEDVAVHITANGLQIDTVVPPPAFAADVNVVRLEIPYGRMRRRIDLPPGRYTLLDRHLADGCLYLRLTGSSL